MQVKKIICKECRNKFIFTAGEQEFYEQKGLNEPKKCKECRKKVRQNKNIKPKN